MARLRVSACAMCVAALLARVTPAYADPADARIEQVCPDAVAEKKRLAARAPSPKAVTPVTRPALRRQLLQMEAQDQAVRGRLIEALNAGGDSSPAADAARTDTLRVDADHLRILRHIVRQDGFPTVAMVGTDGVGAAFLLTQHADGDPAFQAQILTVVGRRRASGEIEGSAYAMLVDRVRVARGVPQWFGTQFEKDGGQWRPIAIEEALHVDRRRRAVGLVSLQNYRCVLHAVYDPH